MAKPDKPLLSLGAKGTIADSLTFQKRGKATMVRRKPVPTDPKTLLQLAQRQIYREAIDAWHALTPEEKEAWRGFYPGLTAYQCFMRYKIRELLKPAPPPEYTEEQLERTYYTSLEAGGHIRVVQKLTVPNRTIIRLSLMGFKLGAPPGTAFYRIRRVSDDSIIAEVSFIPDTWGGTPDEWHEYEFDTPVTINEEVRIGVEYNDGDLDNRLNVRYADDVKANELWCYYDASWIDVSARDFTYIYTYTLP